MNKNYTLSDGSVVMIGMAVPYCWHEWSASPKSISPELWEELRELKQKHAEECLDGFKVAMKEHLPITQDDMLASLQAERNQRNVA